MIYNKKLYAILAVDENNGIGYNNKILYHNKVDMYIFKYITTQLQSCIVGRTTYEGLPNSIKKSRQLYVLSSNSIEDESITVVKNISDIRIKTNSAIVIGGAKIYEALAPFVDVWFITTFKNQSDQVDTYLPHSVIATYRNMNNITIYEDDHIVIDLYR